jgi:hypothetical protein
VGKLRCHLWVARGGGVYKKQSTFVKHKLPPSFPASSRVSPGPKTMAVPVGRLAASTLLQLLVWLPIPASACDRCVRHSKAAYYTSSLTLAGTYLRRRLHSTAPSFLFSPSSPINSNCGDMHARRRLLRVRHRGRLLQRRAPRRRRPRAVPRRRRLRRLLPGTVPRPRSRFPASTSSRLYVCIYYLRPRPARRCGARTGSCAPRRAPGWWSRTAPGPTAPTSCSAAPRSRPWRAPAWPGASPASAPSTSSTRGKTQ